MFFQSFGEEVLNTISDFATQASTALIDEIRIPLLTCLTIYFLIKGYLITYGRIESPLSDFILTAGKILLVTYFGLNALNYVNDVIPAIRGLESMLVNVLRLPGSPDITTQGAWGAIDRMWAELMIVNDKALAIAGKVSVMSSFGTWFALFLLGVLMSIISVALTFAATGVLIINEIALTLTLAFGPLFICCLMFPVVRSWFDGWIKAVATYLFGAVMVAAVILLVTKIFSSFSADLLTSLENYESGRPLITVWLPVLKFIVLGLSLTSLVKLIPNIAAAVVGGVALQAVGLGQMMNDTWKGARDIGGGFVAGVGIGAGNAEMKKNAQSQIMSREGFGEHGTVAAAVVGAAFGSSYRLGRTLMSLGKNESTIYSMEPGSRSVPSPSTGAGQSSRPRSDAATSAGSMPTSTSASAPGNKQETPEQTIARMNADGASRQSERVAQFAAQDAAYLAGQNPSAATASQPSSSAGAPSLQASHSTAASTTDRLSQSPPAQPTSPPSAPRSDEPNAAPNEAVARTNADILRDRFSKS